ncbi:TonB-dependent receptor [Gynurincola endophyticus]|uniref:TonB-dependent receptor n=1 Tax=Gynurincola endophyticus TaxID=2479004 RepID=UPI000F8DE7CD|nr:TonB-dependent receptor [Gynurincola endophyticus]
MNYRLLLLPFLILLSSAVIAQTSSLSGQVTDAVNSEWLTGASVKINQTDNSKGFSANAVVGLNGAYRINGIPVGKYRIVVSYVGYNEITEEIVVSDVEELTKNYKLTVSGNTLSTVTVRSGNAGSDYQARKIERESQSVINVVSAKQIELSPDITVANVIQRVSGLSIERNASGDPQYAIVRGMDKRYNNTLVNGIKIPSPDNENRFVPLDIFPAVFLERLEVYKSLTANMEADAIGGTVNMVMKSAPSRRVLEGDLQIGYNQENFNRDFATYDRSKLQRNSPRERFGSTYRARPDDFPVENMMIKNVQALPDVFGNLTYGDRFLNDKLGLMVGGSFQNSYRPVTNYFYDPTPAPREGNPLFMRRLIDRQTSSQLQRAALHVKLDYVFNENNKISLYGGQYMLNEFRVRDQVRRENFVSTATYSEYPVKRFSNIFQTVSVADLRGEHKLAGNLTFDWSAVYALAHNDRPDDGVFATTGTVNSSDGIRRNEIVYFQGQGNSRTWEENKDTDLSVYLNFKYRPFLINDKTEIQFGGMGRNKRRDNNFIYYNYSQIFGQYKGVEWNDFDEVRFTSMANPLGSGDRSNLIYDALEDVYAAYINTNWQINKTNITAGVRVEHTRQGYEIDPLAASSNSVELKKENSYTDLFPSLSIKHALTNKAFLKATYFRGISRPGFYEIVPVIRSNGGGDNFYDERGNADLRPSYGQSVDLRYEYFPSGVDQILVGVFYKKIKDPIEYGFPQVTAGNSSPQTDRILPQNFNDATNFGVEADYTKYFNRFGVRLNYTFTLSEITTNKIILNADGSATLVDETRALQGQSKHIGNVSLLWKDQKRRLDAQLVFNYTGERIAVVSPYHGADQFMRPMTQMDFSIEKGIGSKWVVFGKMNNIFNTPYELYIKRPLAVPDDAYPYQTDPHNLANVRRDIYGQSYRLGVRYKIN